MLTNRRRPPHAPSWVALLGGGALVAALGAALAAAGCDRAEPAGSAGSAHSADSTDSTDSVASAGGAGAAAPSAAPSTSGAASPISERDAEERREFEEAIEGLSFDGGTVEVLEVLATDEAAARAHAARGEELLRTNQRTKAIGQLVLAVRSAPDVADLYVLLGNAFTTKGKTEHAAASYRAAARLDDESTEARYQLAMALSRDGRNEEAIDTMQTVLAIDPDHPLAHERLAIWHYYAGDYAAAWEHVTHARRVNHAMPPQFMDLLEKVSPERAAKQG